ncbi:lysostaphin resistance A-like protein [Lysobacter tyrosinilyticus]
MSRTASSGIGLFLLLTLLLSCVFYALIIGTGHLGAARGMYVTGLMWCPGIAAMLTCRLRGESLARLGWSWGAWRWQVTSYLVPLAYASIAYAVVWGVGLGGFGNSQFVDSLGEMLGWPRAPAWLAVTATFLLLATVGMVRSVGSGLGEEIGWRGFLAPALVERMGFTRGALVTGVIWGVWHLPILLFADYNAGTPWWFAMSCFFALVLSGSVIMTWLRLRSGSLWAAALVHGSHNLFIQAFFTPMTAPRGAITPWAIDEFGFVLPLVMSGFALYFWSRRAEIEGDRMSVGQLDHELIQSPVAD